MSPLSSGSKNKNREKTKEDATSAGFLLALIFNLENGDEMFLQNFQ
jgi:hypothetical protein